MSKSRGLVGASSAALVVSGLMLAVPVPGWAQLEEIVVTTRKKTENLQEVPIAVDAISAEQIERQGISSVADVTKMSTSVQFDQSYGPSDTRIAVRGLSNTRGRSNVAFLVDGVDVTTENFVSAGSGLLTNQRLLTDVERIEIVKGPQSALYGRAAFAGAIAYTTKGISDELEGQVRFEAGNYGVKQLDGSIGGPIAGLEDVLGVRLSGATWESDGFYSNAVTANGMGGESGWGTALTVEWTPADAVSVRLRSEYSDSDYEQRPSIRIGGGTQPDDGRNLTFYPYPVDPDIIQGDASASDRFGTTNLSDFGQYCPEGFDTQPGIDAFNAANAGDPDFVPLGPDAEGVCQGSTLGSARGQQPAVDPDPITGQDYKGTSTQLFRTSLNASIDYDFGTFTSITGVTNYNAKDELDQDLQHSPAGQTSFDEGVFKAHQQGKSELRTDQFSQELRFASSFDGPVNFTVGGLFWREDREQLDLNYIIACVEYAKQGAGVVWPDEAAQVSGMCDGTNGSISDWQQQAQQIFPCVYEGPADNRTAVPNPTYDPSDPYSISCIQGARTPAPWAASTEHWSTYLNLAWDITDTFQATFEARYVNEDFTLLRQNFSACSFTIFSPFSPTAPVEGVVTTGADDIVCQNEQVMNPDIPAPPAPGPNGNWQLLEGSTVSSFVTPKVTLNWKPTDTATYYFSWGKGIKPGGINTISSGGPPGSTINQERFDSEIVQAWELGWKTDWEAAGFLRFNGALFLNDYTDKQVGTQIIRPGGFLSPRVINIDAAEVWGLELELTWQPEMLEGLVLTGQYTFLDARYTDFIDESRSVIKAAQAGNCTVIVKDGSDPALADPSQRFCAINMNGNQLERTPENAFVGNFQYTAQFMETDFDWFWEGTALYQDERFLNFENAVSMEDYWIADTRFGLTGEKFEFLIFIDNLFEDDTIKTGGTGPDFAQQVTQLAFVSGFGVSQQFGLLPAPRTFGARVTVRF
jgi:iron complex outermembrane receptor protein